MGSLRPAMIVPFPASTTVTSNASSFAAASTHRTTLCAASESRLIAAPKGAIWARLRNDRERGRPNEGELG